MKHPGREDTRRSVPPARARGDRGAGAVAPRPRSPGTGRCRCPSEALPSALRFLAVLLLSPRHLLFSKLVLYMRGKLRGEHGDFT